MYLPVDTSVQEEVQGPVGACMCVHVCACACVHVCVLVGMCVCA